MGGGVIRGGFCPKLGQRLSRGDDKRTGDRSLCPCYLHKSNWRVREVETSGRRVVLGEQKRTTTDWKMPYICMLALYKVSWKTGIFFFNTFFSVLKKIGFCFPPAVKKKKKALG